MEKPENQQSDDENIPEDTSMSRQAISLCFSVLSLISILVFVPGIYFMAGMALLGDVRPTNTRPQEILDFGKIVYYALSAIYVAGVLLFMLFAFQTARHVTLRDNNTGWFYLKLFNIASISCVFICILLKINGQPPFPSLETLQLFIPSSLAVMDMALFFSYFLLMTSSVLLFVNKALRKH